MNIEDIKKILKDEMVVDYISRLRTNFPLEMDIINFFRIFFVTLHSYDSKIKGEYIRRHFALDDTPSEYGIQLRYGEEEFINHQFNYTKLKNDLINYNKSQGDMSMLTSAHALIDLFIGVLEEE